MEAERKEKKRQKEQDRKQRLKAEGKLLTAKQKLEKSRAEAMLESLRAQGVELPEVGAKRPRPGTRIRPNKKNQQQNSTESAPETPTSEGAPAEPQPAEEKPVDPESLIKDSWDASSDEEESKEEPKPVQVCPFLCSCGVFLNIDFNNFLIF